MQPAATAPSPDGDRPSLDLTAFAGLYRRYADAVYRYHVRHVGDHDEAEDLTAATFDRALVAFGRYQEEGHAAAWLFAIARRVRLDHERRRRPAVELAQAAAVADAAPSPDERALRAEAARELRQLVAALPADQQEALALRPFAAPGDHDSSEPSETPRLGRPRVVPEKRPFRGAVARECLLRRGEGDFGRSRGRLRAFLELCCAPDAPVAPRLRRRVPAPPLRRRAAHRRAALPSPAASWPARPAGVGRRCRPRCSGRALPSVPRADRPGAPTARRASPRPSEPGRSSAPTSAAGTAYECPTCRHCPRRSGRFQRDWARTQTVDAFRRILFGGLSADAAGARSHLQTAVAQAPNGS